MLIKRLWWIIWYVMYLSLSFPFQKIKRRETTTYRFPPQPRAHASKKRSRLNVSVLIFLHVNKFGCSESRIRDANLFNILFQALFSYILILRFIFLKIVKNIWLINLFLNTLLQLNSLKNLIIFVREKIGSITKL